MIFEHDELTIWKWTVKLKSYKSYIQTIKLTYTVEQTITGVYPTEIWKYVNLLI